MITLTLDATAVHAFRTALRKMDIATGVSVQSGSRRTFPQVQSRDRRPVTVVCSISCSTRGQNDLGAQWTRVGRGHKARVARVLVSVHNGRLTMVTV